MKSFIKRVFLLLSLIVALSGIFRANLVFANQHPCNLRSEGDDAIPNTFSVGDCLVAPGQEGSKFVPKKDSSLNPDEEGPLPEGEVRNQNPIASAIVEAIDLLVKLIASFALIVFIVGALLTVTSEGKEDRLEKGKTAMLYAIVGLIVAFFSFIIVTFVQSVLF